MKKFLFVFLLFPVLSLAQGNPGAIYIWSGTTWIPAPSTGGGGGGSTLAPVCMHQRCLIWPSFWGEGGKWDLHRSLRT